MFYPSTNHLPFLSTMVMRIFASNSLSFEHILFLFSFGVTPGCAQGLLLMVLGGPYRVPAIESWSAVCLASTLPLLTVLFLWSSFTLICFGRRSITGNAQGLLLARCAEATYGGALRTLWGHLDIYLVVFFVPHLAMVRDFSCLCT